MENTGGSQQLQMSIGDVSVGFKQTNHGMPLPSAEQMSLLSMPAGMMVPPNNAASMSGNTFAISQSSVKVNMPPQANQKPYNPSLY